MIRAFFLSLVASFALQFADNSRTYKGEVRRCFTYAGENLKFNSGTFQNRAPGGLLTIRRS